MPQTEYVCVCVCVIYVIYVEEHECYESNLN